MGRIIKLYNTWEKVKDIFVKPSLKVYFGKWKNDPNLPVWRKRDKRPLWLSFYIFNWDVIWKEKWGEPRYEFPPQFTIVAFGLSLSFTLHTPIQNEFCNDDHYWESILNHLYNNKSGTLKETIEYIGVWRYLGDGTKEGISYFAVRPEYIKNKYKQEYIYITNSIRESTGDIIL